MGACDSAQGEHRAGRGGVGDLTDLFAAVDLARGRAGVVGCVDELGGE